LLFKSTTEKLDPPQMGKTPQLRRIGRGIDAAFQSREHLTDIYLSANGSTCIRLTPEISREGSDPVYGWRGLLERGCRRCGNAWSI
jgi:hypothetical protein